jgi:hypothetical protein
MPLLPRVRPLALLLVALAAVVAGTAALPGEALATKDYAKQEGKDCSYCHISDKGSGPRNAKGREYEANGHRFGVKSWSSDANEQKYLRASSAVVAQWYAEAMRLLDELAKEEKLPGGLALVDGTRDKFKMFKGPWLRQAKKLLALGDRGQPNALVFLAKVESQFGTTDEGREATGLLDGMAKDAKTKDAVATARAAEKARVLLLQGVTEFQLGRADEARALLTQAKADPAGKAWEKEIAEALAALPPAK